MGVKPNFHFSLLKNSCFQANKQYFLKICLFPPGGSLRPERGEKVPSAPVAASIQTTDGGTEGVEGWRGEEEGRWQIVLGITWGLFQLSISILYHSCDYCIKFDSRLIFLRGQNTNHSNFVQRIIHFIKRPFLLPFAASEIRIEPFLTVCIKSVFQWISS